MLGSLVTQLPIPSASSLSTVGALDCAAWWSQVDHISVANVDNPVSVEGRKISIRSPGWGSGCKTREAVRDDGRAGNQRWRSAQRGAAQLTFISTALRTSSEPARHTSARPLHAACVPELQRLRACPSVFMTCKVHSQSFFICWGVYLLVTFYVFTELEL